MSDTDSLSASDAQALHALDEYYASLLGCATSDLRRPGWTTVRARAESDPMALLFGLRMLITIIAPVTAPGSFRVGEAGVAALAPELRESASALLRATPPQRLYAPNSLASLDALNALVSARTPEPLESSDEADLTLWYVTRPRWRPRPSRWQEWIEQLDASTEDDPFAISLLARYGGGSCVVRDSGVIVAHIGLRAHSPHVWELLKPSLTNAALIMSDDHPDDLVATLIACATRFVLNDGRQPVCTTARGSPPMYERALTLLGYQPYARSSVYTSAMR